MKDGFALKHNKNNGRNETVGGEKFLREAVYENISLNIMSGKIINLPPG